MRTYGPNEDRHVAINYEKSMRNPMGTRKELHSYLFDLIFNYGSGTLSVHMPVPGDDTVREDTPTAIVHHGEPYRIIADGETYECHHGDSCAAKAIGMLQAMVREKATKKE